jgi:lipopolysaccharide transport system permease protein
MHFLEGLQKFRVVLTYRQFIWSCVSREFYSRYRNSVLGTFWAVLNPLAMIFIYTVIFSQIMRTKLPGIDSIFAYSIYLCSGTLVWNLFAENTMRCINVFLENANMLKKINFPRICLPLVVTCSSLINFLIIFVLYVVFLIVVQAFPGVYFLGVLPLLFVLMLFSVGLGILLGLMNVFFRDIGQLMNVVIQLWFWFTPIVYPVGIIPGKIRLLMQFNPMYPIIDGFHNIFVLHSWPQWQGVMNVGLLSLIICIATLKIYHRHIGEVVDEL